MKSYYSGATVLVTGASRGLGAAFAERLGDIGARVLLVSRSPDALASVAERVRQRGSTADVFVADLSAPGAASHLVSQLDERGETVDVLINNAGYGIFGPVLETPPDDVEGTVMLNAVTLSGLTRQLAPGMVARGRGGILNLGSISSHVPAPTLAVYAATKAYVLSFTDALHAELDGSGVHVTCLCPDLVQTGFGDRAGINPEYYADRMPMERVVDAGLAGLAANRRRVAPGWRAKFAEIASGWIPTGLTLRVTEWELRQAR